MTKFSRGWKVGFNYHSYWGISCFVFLLATHLAKRKHLCWGISIINWKLSVFSLHVALFCNQTICLSWEVQKRFGENPYMTYLGYQMNVTLQSLIFASIWFECEIEPHHILKFLSFPRWCDLLFGFLALIGKLQKGLQGVENITCDLTILKTKGDIKRIPNP